MRHCLLAILLVLFTGCSAFTSSKRDLSQLVAGASEGRAHLVNQFSGPDSLTGVVVAGTEPGGRQGIAWATRGHRYLLVGTLFDEKGRDLSAQAYDDHVAVRQLPIEAFYRQVTQAPAVTQFPGGERTLYVFADSDCVYCRLLFQQVAQMETLFDTRGVRIRWIMVGTMSSDSAARGAAILERGLAGLVLNEQQYDVVAHHGGIEPAESGQMSALVDQNTRLLMASGSRTQGTPTLVWRSARGPQVLVNAPNREKLLAIIDELLPDTEEPR